MQEVIESGRMLIEGFVSLAEHAQSPLLLLIRLYWGWQFMQDGWGKLTHLDRVAQFFTSLSLPAPGTTALLVSPGRADWRSIVHRWALHRGWSRWFSLSI